MRSLLATSLPVLLAAAPAAAGHLQMEKITERVHLVRPAPDDDTATSNAAFVVLPDRVLVFDTLASRDLMVEMMGMIQRVTTLPVTLVALSHWHPDHAGGLEYFDTLPHTLYATPEALAGMEAHRRRSEAFLRKWEKQLVAQSRSATAPEELAEVDARLGEVRTRLRMVERLPGRQKVILVPNAMELAPGGTILQLVNRGGGHTDGDLTLYLPGERVMLAGDLLSVSQIPNLADADTSAWIARLDQLEKAAADRFLPGHGPAGKARDIAALRDYLRALRALVQPLVAAGSPLQEVGRLKVPMPYDAWGAQDLWLAGCQHVYHELRRTGAGGDRR